jgi:hypothetical protein
MSKEQSKLSYCDAKGTRTVLLRALGQKIGTMKISHFIAWALLIKGVSWSLPEVFS